MSLLTVASIGSAGENRGSCPRSTLEERGRVSADPKSRREIVRRQAARASRSHRLYAPSRQLRSAWPLVLVLVLLLGACGAGPVSSPPRPAPSLITYGIVPRQLPSPSVLSASLAAMQGIARGKPFIAHLYIDWADYRQERAKLASDIAAYAHHGMHVDLALRYVPTPQESGDTSAFASFVAQVVSSYARQPALSRIQVTNEANSPFNAGASDGAYPQAMQALVSGIEAGHSAMLRSGSHVKLGFNWFYSFGPSADHNWWSQLGALGGARFAHDVSWVGVDDYPGTWVPTSLPGSAQSAAAAGEADIVTALDTVRHQLMPLAGLGPSVQLGLSEVGWATNPPARTDSEQALLVHAFTSGACSVARSDNVRFLQWFELSGSDKNGLAMGLLHADFAPKPGYVAYQSVVRAGCP